MGSGTSRGKKVAPACVGQVTSIKASCKPLQPPRIHAILRKCAQRDRRHDSGSSGEDNDGERDAVPERRGWVSEKRSPAKKSSKTYGLCHARREGEEDSGPEEPPGANKRKTTACPKHQLRVSTSQILNQYISVQTSSGNTTEVVIRPFHPPALSIISVLLSGIFDNRSFAERCRPSAQTTVSRHI